jgi:hypothetical protein
VNVPERGVNPHVLRVGVRSGVWCQERSCSDAMWRSRAPPLRPKGSSATRRRSERGGHRADHRRCVGRALARPQHCRRPCLKSGSRSVARRGSSLSRIERLRASRATQVDPQAACKGDSCALFGIEPRHRCSSRQRPQLLWAQVGVRCVRAGKVRGFDSFMSDHHVCWRAQNTKTAEPGLNHVRQDSQA